MKSRKILTNLLLGTAIFTIANTQVYAQKNDSKRESDSLKLKDTLAAKSSSEDVVVFTGYGRARSLRNSVGAVTSIDGKVLENRPSPNIMDGLAGRIPGLQIFTSSGEPTETSTFNFNGPGSLGAGSTPLIILDGAQVDPTTILTLNPNDVESSNFLRDASATAIYGARAANGVLVINTKKGSSLRPFINFTQALTTSKRLGSKFYDDYFMNTSELLAFWKETGLFTDAQINGFLNYENAGENVNTKWGDVYYKKSAPMRQTNLSVSGGGGKTTYFLSGGLITDEGLAYRSKYDKYSFRSNINTQFNDWISVGMNIYMAYDKRQSNAYGSNSTNRGIALLAQPFYSPYDSTGKMYDYIPGWNRYSPEYLAKEITSDANNIQFNPNAFVLITPIKGLQIKSMGAMDAYDFRLTNKRLPSYLGSPNSGQTSEYFYRAVQRTWNNTIDYSFNFSDSKSNVHSFDILGGHEWIDYKYNNFSGSSTGQSDDRLTMLKAGATNITAYDSTSSYAYLSFFARASYDFNKKYFVDASIRRDKSSRFGRNLKGGTFYSVGAMWKLNNEEFLKNVGWIDDLSLRGSYGLVGNSDIGNYNSLALIGTGTYNNGTGWSLSAPGNPYLGWEKQRKTSVSINATLFHDLNVIIEGFNYKTSNMLMDVPYPYTSGFSSITQNTGTLGRKGFSFNFRYDVIRNKDWVVTPWGNITYQKEKVLSLFQGKSSWVIPNTGVAYVVGKPVQYLYPIWAGVNKETGAPQWYVPGEDPMVTRKDGSDVSSAFSASDLQQNTGIRRNPPVWGGFGLDVSYKGFSFSTAWTYVSGKYIINNDRYFYENPFAFAGYNTAKNVEDYWKQPGDNARYPSPDQTLYMTQFDSRLIENASFLRMKTIQLAYNLPQSLLEKTKVFKNVQFYVTGRNLITVTPYSGPDPEIDSNLTLGQNPNTKQYSAGVNVQF